MAAKDVEDSELNTSDQSNHQLSRSGTIPDFREEHLPGAQRTLRPSIVLFLTGLLNLQRMVLKITQIYFMGTTLLN